MTTTEYPATGFELARRAMIDSQLRTSGINEPWLLATMANLPREDFVPESQRASAYIDRAVPLGDGRFLAPALVQGRLLAEAEPKDADKVLVVTGGTGYLAALVKKLAGSVDSVDATEVAKGLPGSNYTLIIIDGAIEQLPEVLVAALAEGGRVATGLVERGVTRVAFGRKTGGAVALTSLSDVAMPVLPEFAAPKHWTF